MSFTFDDIEKTPSIKATNKMDRLAARIEQLKSQTSGNATDTERVAAQIAGLEAQRQRLHQVSHGLKPVEIRDNGEPGEGGPHRAPFTRAANAPIAKIKIKSWRRS